MPELKNPPLGDDSNLVVVSAVQEGVRAKGRKKHQDDEQMQLRIRSLGPGGQRMMEEYAGNTPEGRMETLERLEQYQLEYDRPPMTFESMLDPKTGSPCLEWTCVICQERKSTFKKPECGRKYSSSTELRRHTREAHPKSRQTSVNWAEQPSSPESDVPVAIPTAHSYGFTSPSSSPVLPRTLTTRDAVPTVAPERTLVLDPFESLAEARDLSGQIDILNFRPVFSGPYSSVYRGKLRETGHSVAIKVINSLKGTALHTMQRKLKRERRIWGALNHPNILPLWGFADDPDSFGSFGGLISPWLRNGDASDFLANNRDSNLDYRVGLWRDVLAGVNYLHSHDPLLVHGDLKPAQRNILIDDSGHAQICDFGLVRVFSEAGSSGMTTTSHHTGTERYLAYELVVAAEDATTTTASDIYAVGCIGLEFIFLQVPYAARQSNAGGRIFFDIKEGKPPAERPADTPLELEYTWEQLETCWSTDPDLRPSAETLLTGLDTRIESSRAITPPPSVYGTETHSGNNAGPNEESMDSLGQRVQGLEITTEGPSRSIPKPLHYGNPLGVFKEKCEQKRLNPQWHVTSTGPSHAPQFMATVKVPGHGELGHGSGATKKLAKRAAASLALASGAI